MLFKTQSASVYGIDAYLVEVEVDVGSARMQDFNVVGLPDKAQRSIFLWPWDSSDAWATFSASN